MGSLAEDARALMVATADVAGEKVKEARERLAEALDSAKDLYQRVQENASKKPNRWIVPCEDILIKQRRLPFALARCLAYSSRAANKCWRRVFDRSHRSLAFLRWH